MCCHGAHLLSEPAEVCKVQLLHRRLRRFLDCFEQVWDLKDSEAIKYTLLHPAREVLLYCSLYSSGLFTQRHFLFLYQHFTMIIVCVR